jgi:hypothetical protein
MRRILRGLRDLANVSSSGVRRAAAMVVDLLIVLETLVVGECPVSIWGAKSGFGRR